MHLQMSRGAFVTASRGDSVSCQAKEDNATFPVRIPMNTLYYGDNLNILRRYIKDETVDLVYLDPPSNSNCNYNVLFAR